MSKQKAQQKWSKTYNDKHGMGTMKIKKESIKQFSDLKLFLGLNNQTEVAEYLIKFHKENSNE